MKALLPVALVLASCATAPPNTPGAGSGKSYTPVIDMRGVDGTRYMDDLTACRDYSASIDANKEVLWGMLGGALVGAAIGASVGNGDMGSINAGMTGGAVGGIGGAGNRAIGRQEAIIGNCMASRGYRVLDGTAQIAFQQPAGNGGFAPHTGTPGAPPTLAPPKVEPVTVASAPPTPELGQDAYVAGKLARSGRCSAAVDAQLKMVAKGAGFETYSALCKGGDTAMIRCEFGNCRELR